MIGFVTEHDLATRANARLWRCVSAPTTLVISGPLAIATQLSQLLINNPAVPLAIFSHGRRRPTHCIVGNDSQPALNEGSLTELGARSVFAMACWTGLVLGDKARQAGAVWWGFDNSVSPPPTAWVNHYKDIFFHILTTFSQLKTEVEIKPFLTDLVLKVEKLERKLLRSGANNPEYFFILRSLKADLKVWIPTAQEPIHHPGSVRRPLEPGD